MWFILFAIAIGTTAIYHSKEISVASKTKTRNLAYKLGFLRKKEDSREFKRGLIYVKYTNIPEIPQSDDETSIDQPSTDEEKKEPFPPWKVKLVNDMYVHNAIVDTINPIIPPLEFDVGGVEFTETTTLPLPFFKDTPRKTIREIIKDYFKDSHQALLERYQKIENDQECLGEESYQAAREMNLKHIDILIAWYNKVKKGDCFFGTAPVGETELDPEESPLAQKCCVDWSFNSDATNIVFYHEPSDCPNKEKETEPWFHTPAFVTRLKEKFEEKFIGPRAMAFKKSVYNIAYAVKMGVGNVYDNVVGKAMQVYTDYFHGRPEAIAGCLLAILLLLCYKYRHKLSKKQEQLVEKVNQLLERIQKKKDVTEEEVDAMAIDLESLAGKKAVQPSDSSDLLRLILALGGVATMYSVALAPLAYAAAGIDHVSKLLSNAEENKAENRSWLTRHFGKHATKYKVFFVTLAVIVALAKTIPMINDHFYGKKFQRKYKNTGGQPKKAPNTKEIKLIAGKFSRAKPKEKDTEIAKKKAKNRNKLAYGLKAFWEEYEADKPRRNEDDDGRYGLAGDWDRAEWINEIIENGGWYTSNGTFLDLNYFSNFGEEWYDEDVNYMEDDYDLDKYLGDRRWDQEHYDNEGPQQPTKWDRPEANRRAKSPEPSKKQQQIDNEEQKKSSIKELLEIQKKIDAYVELPTTIPEELRHTVIQLQTQTIPPPIDTSIALRKSTELIVETDKPELPEYKDEFKTGVREPINLKEFELSKDQMPKKMTPGTLVTLQCKDKSGKRKVCHVANLNQHFKDCDYCWQKATGSRVPKATKTAVTGALFSSVGQLSDSTGEAYKTGFVYAGGIATCRHNGVDGRIPAAFKSGNVNITIKPEDDMNQDYGFNDFTFYAPTNAQLPKSIPASKELPSLLSPVMVLARGVRPTVTLVVGHICMIEKDTNGNVYYWATMSGAVQLEGGDSGSPVVDANGHCIGVFCAYNASRKLAMITPLPPADKLPVHTKKL